MAIQKPFLEPFTQKELMQFIDHYVEKHEVLHVPGHSWEHCDMLARFFGFGYSRKWSQAEIDTLRLHYAQLGAEGTSKFLPFRSPLDCKAQADHVGLRTSIKPLRKSPSSWTIGEIEILEKYYPVIGAKAAALLSERSERACITQAQNLNIAVHRVPWSNSELEILQKYYPQIGFEVEKLLPGKSRRSIYVQAGLMSLESPSKWTPTEDDLLRLHYPEMGKDVAKFFFGRRSEIACAKRAIVLGLSYNNNRRPWTEDELSILDRHYPLVGSAVSEMLPGRSIVSCQKKAAQRNLTYQSSKINKPKTAKRWSSEELEILRENYPQMGPGVCQLLPNRTRMACIKMAESLGLDAGINRWSTEEDDILREHYPEMGAEAVVFLPGRTKSACQSRAKALKISREDTRWTAAEDALLKSYYPAEGIKAFQRLPSRTEDACQTRVAILGIERLRVQNSDTLKARGRKLGRRRFEPEMVHSYITAHPKAKMKEIAAEFGCSISTVAHIKQELGFVRQRRETTEFDLDAVANYINTHPYASNQEIAGEFECTIADVEDVKEQLGLFPLEMSKKDSEKLKAYIVEHPQSSRKEIAEKFKCSPRTVSDVIERMGGTHRKYTSINLDELRAYLAAHPNTPNKKIAEDFNCSLSTISNAKKRLGIANKQFRKFRKIDPDELRAHIATHPHDRIKDIANHFGCSEVTISTIKRKLGLSRKVGPKVDLNKMEAYMIAHPLSSPKEIAEEFDCGIAKVYQIRKRLGLTKPKV